MCVPDLAAAAAGDGVTRILEIDGIALPLAIRRHPRARRIILRVATGGSGLTLTLPKRARVADGLALIEREREWISARLRALPPPRPFIDGAEIPYLGEPHRIRHCPDRARGIIRERGVIEVGGPAHRLGDRLIRWLRQAALEDLLTRSAAKAAELGRPVGKIRVRDMRSRWGSCSVCGDLTYNWRLILAPIFVVDYVAAHEVAHLAWRHHDAVFWQTVSTLAMAMEAARQWLREEGASLLSYG